MAIIGGPDIPFADEGAAVPYHPVDSTIVTARGDVQFEARHDPRALYLPMLHGAKFKRGYLYQDKTALPTNSTDPTGRTKAITTGTKGRPLGLSFLYNPTSVQVSYSVATDVTPSGSAPGSGVALVGVPGAVSVAWDLILDRTYEVQRHPSHPGVRADVEQLEKIVQYTQDSPFMQYMPVWVVFGNQPRFYGALTGFSVVYTNWTQNLIPYRAALSGMTLQVYPTNTKALARAALGDSAPSKKTSTAHATWTRVNGTGRRVS